MTVKQWEGKVAVITGAASGIGAGLTKHCMSLGMHVVAADVDNSGLKQLELMAENLNPASLKTVIVDVRDEEQVEQLAQDVFDQFNEVNLLFNNAGVLIDGKSWERSIKDWRWIIDVNVMGVVYGIKSFVPRMINQGKAGRVINTSSIGGLLGGGAYLAPYQGTKHMITCMTESLFQELDAEDTKITASVLCPAEVATGIWESDRHRPNEEKNILSSENEQMLHDAIAGGVANGLAPDDFAKRVFVGIEADKFWLLPQPEFKTQFESRHASIINETNPTSMLEMIGLK